MNAMSIETALRVLFYIVVGFLLLTATYWFIRSVYKSFFSTELVIAPFKVIGQKDDNEQLGTVLADMLQARLNQVQLDLVGSQKGLLPVPAVDNPLSNDPRVLAVPDPIIRSNENTNFEILNTPKLNVTVGGVEVGGFFPWLQSLIVKERTLHLSVYREGERAVIAGDLSPFLGEDNGALWIETPKGTPDEIANSLAYELIHRKLSKGSTDKIRALNSGEFRSLLGILSELAELNQKVVLGRMVTDSYADIFIRLEKIALRVPQWSELIRLTAMVAERAENNERAIFYYKQLQELVKNSKSTPTANDEQQIGIKIQTLSGKTASAPIQNEQAFLEAVKRYASHLGLPAQEEPKISFVKPKVPQVFGLWNEKDKQYEVNPEKISTLGLPERTTLEARFLAKNFDRCFGGGAQTPNETISFWNDFRHSLTDYILSTEPGGSRMIANFGRSTQWSLLEVLRQMEKNLQGNSKPVREMALALLDRYECDWTEANFLEKALVVNQKLKIMEDRIIQDAVADGLKGKSAL